MLFDNKLKEMNDLVFDLRSQIESKNSDIQSLREEMKEELEK